MNQAIIFDAQVFQNSTVNRGMGRYSLNLLIKTISILEKNLGMFDLYFMLTKFNNRDVRKAKKILKTLTKKKINWIEIDLSSEKFENIQDLSKSLNKSLFEKLSAIKAREIKYIVLSNFEVGQSPSVLPEFADCKTIVVHYDIIPYLFHQNYLDSDGWKKEYYSRYQNLLKADQICAISQASKDDLSIFLGINSERITNIAGGSIPFKGKIKRPSIYFRSKKFILFPSGDDQRKNNEITVKAVIKALEKTKEKFDLVITSIKSEDDKVRLNKIWNKEDGEAKLHFPGHVEDSELAWLYQNSEIVIFPTLYEGLGLPVLEAVDHDKKIIVSNIRPFKEISKTAFWYCNPYSPDDISNSIHQALKSKRVKNSAEYRKIKTQFSWDKTAKKFADTVIKSKQEYEIYEKSNKNLDIFFPDPTSLSAVGYQVRESLIDFEKHNNLIRLIYENNGFKGIRADFSKFCYLNTNVEEYQRKDYLGNKLNIYHIGSSPLHSHILLNALALPGIIVFHDTNLSGLWEHLLQNKLITKKRFEEERKLSSNFLFSTVNAAIGCIVHSDYAFEKVKSVLSLQIPIIKLNLPVSTIENFSKNVSKNQKIQIGLAGLITKEKGLREFISLIKKYREKADFAIIGSTSFLAGNNELNQILSDYSKDVSLCTNVSDFEFQEKLRNFDLMINYRSSYNGETSRSTLEALRYGVPTIVRDVGWFSELPESAVIKSQNYEQVVRKVEYFIKNPDALNKFSRNGQKYVENNHTHKKYVNETVKFCNQVTSPENIINNPNYNLSRQLRSGLTPTHNTVSEIYLPQKIQKRKKIVNMLPIASDFETKWFLHWEKTLNQYIKHNEDNNRVLYGYHRKLWEFVVILQALKERGLLLTGKSGLGFACGEEPLPSIFARYGVKVVATDQSPEDEKAKMWSNHQLAFDINSLYYKEIVDKKTFSKNVTYRSVDMNNIPKDLKNYDFTWSACSFEHLGSINKGLDFLNNQLECLKPGGIGVHTTEVNISSDEDTVEEENLVLFRKSDLMKAATELKQNGHDVEIFDWSLGDHQFDNFIDQPPYTQRPHLRLRINKFDSTSMVFIVKKSSK